MAVAARTIDDSLGRLSQRVAVKVKPEDVPLNLRGEGVTTHTMRLTWGPPIRYYNTDIRDRNMIYKRLIEIGLSDENIFHRGENIIQCIRHLTYINILYSTQCCCDN